MPAKNIVKQYLENSFYHIYNRGVEKRNIFLDQQDYQIFIKYLRQYLDPSLGSDPKIKSKSLADDIHLVSYCLMPNHFHLLIRQTSKLAITKLMRSVCTKYVMYFNAKYERVGGLFQGKYKAILVDQDVYLLHLSKYIHLNPQGSDPKKTIQAARDYPYSSYKDFLKEHSNSWIHPEYILSFFQISHQSKQNPYLSYENFTENLELDNKKIIEGYILEDKGRTLTNP